MNEPLEQSFKASTRGIKFWLFWLFWFGFVISVLILTNREINWANQQIRFNEESKRWPKVRGVVESSTLEEHQGRKTVFEPKIVYSFKVNDQQFKGSNLRFGLAYGTREKAEGLRRMFREKQQVMVFYRPKDPTISCLLPGSMPEEVRSNLPMYNFVMVLSFVALVGGVVTIIKSRTSVA